MMSVWRIVNHMKGSNGGQKQQNSTILIAEAVILGKVPDSYVVVPQDDILDALD